MTNINQKGFTIPELLIASVVSLFLIAGVIKIYLNVKTTYEMQREIAQMQDNARIALTILEQEIHTAGYVGCPRLTDAFFRNNFSNSSGINFMPQNIIKGRQVGQTDSDEITVQKSEPGGELVENMTDYNELFMNALHIFKKNEVVAISECDYVGIDVIDHVVKHGDKQTLQFTKPVSHLFQQHAVVNPVRVKQFLIKPTERNNNQGLPITALYSQDLTGVEQELVTGISKMKMSYLEKLSGDLTQQEFVPAEQIQHWEDVIAIKIDILVESESEITDKPIRYVFHDKSYMPTDKRLHREWSTLVTIRSRAMV